MTIITDDRQSWPDYLRFAAGISAFSAIMATIFVLGPSLPIMIVLWAFIFVLMIVGRALFEIGEYLWRKFIPS